MPIDYQKRIDQLFSRSVLADLVKIEASGTVTMRDGTTHTVVKHICLSKAPAYYQFSLGQPVIAIPRNNRMYAHDSSNS